MSDELRSPCPLRSVALAVGQPDGTPVEALPDVRRADTASWQYGRPDGVTDSLQVIAYSVEPPVGNRAINLFANDDWRPADGDETKKSGP
jgi:hypothetical protein